MIDELDFETRAETASRRVLLDPGVQDMSDAAEAVVTILGVGGGTAGAVLILANMVKNSIAVAVQQAGQRELVRLKSDLDESAAEKRRQFDSTMEDFRRSAARDLESFKTELQLAAEVRRQVAAKKVEALIAIAAAGEALQRDVLNVRPGNPTDRAAAMAKVMEYMVLVRSNGFLFEKVVAGKFHQYAADLVKAETDLNLKFDPDALDRASAAVDGFLQLARMELGVSVSTPVATTP